MEDKKKIWRHKIAYRFAHLISGIPLLPYTCKCEKAPVLNEPCLILSNHLTESDLFILLRSFPEHMYFVCGEHLYRSKLGPLFGKFYEPIPAARGGNMTGTVIQILQKLKNGHNVMMFPEGSLSFHGVSMPLKPAIGKLVKRAGCGLVTYKITGGYFVAPRWSYKPRTGHMEGNIAHIYTSAELKQLTAQEITDRINQDLYEDAYARQKQHPVPYRSLHLAEGIENYLEICPNCGSYDSLTSARNRFHCKNCSLEGIYDKYGFLHGKDLPFDNVRDWGFWMEKRFDDDIQKLSADSTSNRALFTESGIRLYQIDTGKHSCKDLLKDAELKIYQDRLELFESGGTMVFDFSKITECSMLYYGKTWLFTHQGKYFGITGDNFHAWKLDRLFQVHFSNLTN